MKYDDKLTTVVRVCPGSVIREPALQPRRHRLALFFPPAFLRPLPRQIQRRVAAAVLRLDVGFAVGLVHQKLDYTQMAVDGRMAQRRLSVPVILRLDFGAGLVHQKLHDF